MVRIGATKCTGQRPTKGKRRRASDEGQTTMGKRRWASDDGQVTMAGVGSGVLHERKEKGKGTYAKEKESMVERRESNVEEGNLRKGIFVYSHPNCPKNHEVCPDQLNNYLLDGDNWIGGIEANNVGNDIAFFEF
ncbi:hypothetical protein E6C27_scaffold1591G00160 [Cucumis melo var. makuwa]|uniref:Uncharacterized protein n=1 Tax=Cucumis melo var. makuwa TaxID=1194695 RepID=A0A5A7U1S2_CUCMM|nr:hypothetical protein E6C27_scaffold1591G00160 [Cucumis melo var. makuwa]